jgi:hypothetical protein
MAPEQVLDVMVRRHVLTTERPFAAVLDGIFDDISQPDIGALFAKLADRVAYDTVTSEIAPYGDADAARAAGRLDTEVLELLHQATGAPGTPASTTP